MEGGELTNNARRLGSQFETDVLRFLRDSGLEAERLARAGANDEGDIILRDGDGSLYTLELKARRDKNSSLSLNAWLKEAMVESSHYADSRNCAQPLPVVVIKNPGKGIADAFVVMKLKDWIGEVDE